MSTKTMDEILTRMLLDAPFRAQLRRNPAQALAAYDLTPAERARLFKFKKRGAGRERAAVGFSPARRSASFSLN